MFRFGQTMTDGTKFGDQIISTSEAGHLVGITPQHVLRLKNSGYFEQVSYGKFRARDVAIGYAKSRADEKKPASTRDSEHARLARAQAIKVEIENRVRLGKLLPRDMVAQTMDGASATLIAQLEALPGRLAGELALITEPGVIRAAIKRETDAIRTAVADCYLKRAEELEGLDDGTADDENETPADEKKVNGHDREI